MATHPSILGWRILQTEEPDGLQSTGPHRVRHAWRDLAGSHDYGTKGAPLGVKKYRTRGSVALC